MQSKLITLFTILLLSTVSALAQGGNSASPTPTPKPAASPSASKVKTPTFRPTKDQITQGQQILINEKLFTGKATGTYGDSRPAIKAYQKAHGLEENGKFDRATLEKMGIALTDAQKRTLGIQLVSNVEPMVSAVKDGKPATANQQTKAADNGPKRPAPFQANDDQIMALQKVLKDGKMFDGAADGKRSDALKDAVKKYQTANNLGATGGINAATLQKAGIALTDKQKEQVAAQAAYDAAHPKTN